MRRLASRYRLSARQFLLQCDYTTKNIDEDLARFPPAWFETNRGSFFFTPCRLDNWFRYKIYEAKSN